MCVYTYTCIHINLYVCMYVCLSTPSMYTYMYESMYAYGIYLYEIRRKNVNFFFKY